jgi:hypothetical protein
MLVGNSLRLRKCGLSIDLQKAKIELLKLSKYKFSGIKVVDTKSLKVPQKSEQSSVPEKYDSNIKKYLATWFNPKDKEFSETRLNLLLALTSEHKYIRELQNYDQVFEATINLLNYYNKTKDPRTEQIINSFLIIFLEKNSQMFTTEQLLKISIELGKNNIAQLELFSILSDSVFRSLQVNINILKKKEDQKFTALLFTYFSTISELSLMTHRNLNVILDYFADFSKALIKENLKQSDLQSLSSLYEFLWMTSISIASILEKRRKGMFCNGEDTLSPVINEKGGQALKKLLNYLDYALTLDNQHSERTPSKSRLYRALYYLKIDGIKLPQNVENFLENFLPFHQMNLEKNVTPSKLEQNLEKILQDLDVKFEREKKLPFCSTDFFVSPGTIIEVNGPSHYVFNTNMPIAKDLLKERVLLLEGYDYMVLDYTMLDAKNENDTFDLLERKFDALKDVNPKEYNLTKLAFNVDLEEKIRKRYEIERRISKAKYLV